MEYIAHTCVAFFITTTSFERMQSLATIAKLTCEFVYG